MSVPSLLNLVPEPYRRMKAALSREAEFPNVSFETIEAPKRLAPHAFALGARVHPDEKFKEATGEDISELATGRIVVLYDPAAPAEWEGPFRVVSYVRCEVESSIGHDVFLSSVSWSWLLESLERHDCEFRAIGGTSTRVLSESFGTLAHRPSSIDLEVRASWTPVLAEPEDMEGHFNAWVHMLCTAAGLPPLPPGVTAFPGRRR